MSMYIIVFILVALYLWYISVIKRRNEALQALSSIDVQLNLRFDLIPNLLKMAKKVMDHEQNLLKDITMLRSSVKQSYNRKDPQAVREHLAAAEALSGKLEQLMVTVEEYPDLKSDQVMIQAMQTYSEAEANIAAARRFYNSAVGRLNNAVEIFPGTIIGAVAGVAAMPFFSAEEGVRAPIDADQLLNTPQKRTSRSAWN